MPKWDNDRLWVRGKAARATRNCVQHETRWAKAARMRRLAAECESRQLLSMWLLQIFFVTYSVFRLRRVQVVMAGR
jgi:hypothetical protein